MNRLLLLIIFVTSCIASFAQEPEYWTGLVEDREAYQKIPMKVTLLKRDYQVLPSSVSLRQYCPPAASQGDHGTCTAWSTTYAARTIAEAVKWGWTDQKIIQEEAFAPIFVYAEVKNQDGKDSECRSGIGINKALQALKDKGAPKLKSFNTQCADRITSWVRDEAKDYHIDSYFRLFGYDQESQDVKIKAVKKALAGNNPVVISMHLPRTFFTPQSDVWERGPINDAPYYHAMCVVGYDDNKAGGAFEIMNSWGSYWANKGFVWVKYKDFADYVDFAFEMRVKKNIIQNKEDIKDDPKPQPKPVIVDETVNLSGSMYFQLSTGEVLTYKLSKDKLPIYKIKERLISGTRYTIFITCNEPAYVYMIGSDLDYNVSQLFPPEGENISPAIDAENDFALPAEDMLYELDNNTGKEYYCLLFSSKELNIENIIKKVKTRRGSFTDIILNVLKEDGLVINESIYGKEEMSFKTMTSGGIVPMIVELSHK